MSARAGTKQENSQQWRGVQPTDPESDPIPVKLEDASGAPHGVPANPISVTGSTVYIGGPNPLPTEDTGIHTNPRRYEIQNAFRSQVLELTDDNPTALITLTTTPARTSGESLYIYKVCITNRCGFLSGVTLEQPVGTLLHNRIMVDNDDSINESFPTPLPVGATGVFARRHSTTGTTSTVEVQVLGLEV